MNKLNLDSLCGLPGEEIIRPGLINFHQKKMTLEAWLVAIASNRLRNYGLLECDDADIPHDAEIQLYRLLSLKHENPYGQYRAYQNRLTKFENALDHRMSQGQTANQK